jgi:hypothetical protein
MVENPHLICQQGPGYLLKSSTSYSRPVQEQINKFATHKHICSLTALKELRSLVLIIVQGIKKNFQVQSTCLRVIHVHGNKDGPLRHLILKIINPLKTPKLTSFFCHSDNCSCKTLFYNKFL